MLAVYEHGTKRLLGIVLHDAGDDFCHFFHAFVVGMDAVWLQFVAVIGKKGMEVDDG